MPPGLPHEVLSMSPDDVDAPLLTVCMCLTGQAAQPPGQAPRREHEASGSSTEGREHATGRAGGGASGKQGGRAPSMPRRVPPWHSILLQTCSADLHGDYTGW